MPRSRRSLDVTNAYRTRVRKIRDGVITRAEREWPTIDRLDGSGWPQRMATVVASAQTEAVRATGGYLTAYLSAETGRRQRAITIDTRRYAGRTRDGRPLAEALESPLIGVRAALKDGKTPEEALRVGLHRATRMVSVDLDHAHRAALTDTIDADQRFTGWERATAGTCGACMALSGTSGTRFEVHPGCNCVPAPKVKGVPDLVPLLTGIEMFRRMTREEQDAQFGEEKAAALRAGDVLLEDLVRRNRLKTGEDDFLTEAPLQDVA